MSQLTVFPVSAERHQREFMALPWELYQNDSNWIPPLRDNQAQLVGFRPHPFYHDAVAQAFLAQQDGKTCGRIVAIVNHAHNRRYNEHRGFFGFFESIDDQQVASALFDAAVQWLSEQGMHWLRGPCNPSLNYECGLLIDNFAFPPTFMMTYNPPYYHTLFEAYGFKKVQDLYAFTGRAEMLETLDKRVKMLAREATRRLGVSLRPLDRRRFAEEVRMFADIYNRSLRDTWGFVPMSHQEADHMAAALRYLIVPEMTCIAEVGGRPVGVVFGILDYNPRIKQINGRLFPFGFLHLLRNRRGIKRVRLMSTNVLPAYQKSGLGLVLLSQLVPAILAWGIEEGEFSWVLESNQPSRLSLERGGAKISRTYRLYDYDAAPTSQV